MDPMLFLKASNATAMFGAAILAALFQFLSRRFGFRYLRFWQWSFIAATGYLAFALLGLILVTSGQTAQTPARLLCSTLALACSFNQLFLLLAGVWEFTGAPPLSRRRVQLGVFVATLLGVVATLAYAFDPAANDARLLLRIGLRYFSAGAAFLLAAALIHSRLRHSDAQAARLVALAFLGYGFAQLLILGIFLWQLSTGAVSPAGRIFGLVDLLFQTLLGGMLAMWLLDRERRQALAAQKRIHTLERFDPVTGLPNREHFAALAQQALADARPARLLLLDVQELRALSEGLGAEHADEVLRQLSTRLLGLLPPGCLLGRLRAEQFGALLRPLEGEETAAAFGQRVHTAFRQPLWFKERALLLSVRLVLADYPADANAYGALLTLAERALSDAREDDPGGIRLVGELHENRTTVLADVHNAVVQGDLQLYYQPILDRQGQLLAFEALLRWRLPDGQLLTPEDFLAAMRQASFTAALDARVLEMGLEQLAHWQRSLNPRLRLAVNLSPASLREPGFASWLLRRVSELKIASGTLELEITETAALYQPVAVQQLLEQLRAGGVELSLDDFGTGFSALTHLRSLPVHRIKLDRSFVGELPTQSRDVAIVTALTTLAHALGLQVTAEGVETREQADFLKDIGVDAQQGFLYARPMPAAAVPAWLNERANASESRHLQGARINEAV